MMQKRSLVAAATACAGIFAAAAWGAALPPLQVPPDAASIESAAYLDAAGYQVVIRQSGDAVYADGVGTGGGHIDAGLAKRLFDDLAKAASLSKLPTAACDASVKGGPLTIVWRGERSPDLRCQTDDRGKALRADALVVAQKLYVENFRHAPIILHGGQPSSAAPGPAPTAAASVPPAPIYPVNYPSYPPPPNPQKT